MLIRNHRPLVCWSGAPVHIHRVCGTPKLKVFRVTFHWSPPPPRPSLPFPNPVAVLPAER